MLTAARAIANQMTMAAVDQAMRQDEMTLREYERFVFAWSWSAARFSGGAAAAQDDYNNRHGFEHYRKRLLLVDRIAHDLAREDSRRFLTSIGR